MDEAPSAAAATAHATADIGATTAADGRAYRGALAAHRSALAGAHAGASGIREAPRRLHCHAVGRVDPMHR
jgi:hypothetical protein